MAIPLFLNRGWFQAPARQYDLAFFSLLFALGDLIVDRTPSCFVDISSKAPLLELVLKLGRSGI